MEKKSIFEKIILREIPSDIIYENERIIVIQDINPQANIHYLIIPKEKFKDVSSIPSNKMNIIQEMFIVAKNISLSNEKLKEYKIVINTGKKADQKVFHLHMHFLSGY